MRDLGLRFDLRDLGLRFDLRFDLRDFRLDLRQLFINLSAARLLTELGIRLIERRESPESTADMMDAESTEYPYLRLDLRLDLRDLCDRILPGD